MKGKYEDCLLYSDLKSDPKTDLGEVDWRSKFQREVDASSAAFVITRGCA